MSRKGRMSTFYSRKLRREPEAVARYGQIKKKEPHMGENKAK